MLPRLVAGAVDTMQRVCARVAVDQCVDIQLDKICPWSRDCSLRATGFHRGVSLGSALARRLRPRGGGGAAAAPEVGGRRHQPGCAPTMRQTCGSVLPWSLRAPPVVVLGPPRVATQAAAPPPV